MQIFTAIASIARYAQRGSDTGLNLPPQANTHASPSNGDDFARQVMVALLNAPQQLRESPWRLANLDAGEAPAQIGGPESRRAWPSADVNPDAVKSCDPDELADDIVCRLGRGEALSLLDIEHALGLMLPSAARAFWSR
ncbi:hypothetical protein NDN01_00250 [Sphingomonas sp. QA11]|uniref:hypothetical protein n=1 Tax=Sphingomonas sp. QA11 TaxID=2950605 RepID=UPI0023492DB5|nr:hypothetical protein [Sphingomonas sp. QA11]WCM27407.1 hypothetical protein NDN01_00250 [Sphingomonas sp. QA11]